MVAEVGIAFEGGGNNSLHNVRIINTVVGIVGKDSENLTLTNVYFENVEAGVRGSGMHNLSANNVHLNLLAHRDQSRSIAYWVRRAAHGYV